MRLRGRIQYRVFTGQFRLSVHRQRRGAVGRLVGPGRGAVEDIVGGDMDQPRPHLRADRSQHRGACLIGREGGGLLGFGGIDVGEGGAVDDHRTRADDRAHRLGVGDIEFTVTEGARGGREPPQLVPEQPTRTGDDQALGQVGVCGRFRRRSGTHAVSLARRDTSGSAPPPLPLVSLVMGLGVMSDAESKGLESIAGSVERTRRGGEDCRWRSAGRQVGVAHRCPARNGNRVPSARCARWWP